MLKINTIMIRSEIKINILICHKIALSNALFDEK